MDIGVVALLIVITAVASDDVALIVALSPIRLTDLLFIEM
jgi:uncharacterized membrane protein YcjF (UPF0283 family)